MSRTQSPIRSSEDRGIHGSVLILSIALLVFSAGIFWVSGARRTVPPAGAQAGTVTPSFSARTSSTISPKAQAAVDSGTARVVLPDGDGTLLLPELAEVTRELNAPDSTIQRDFEILDIVLDAYRKLMVVRTQQEVKTTRSSRNSAASMGSARRYCLHTIPSSIHAASCSTAGGRRFIFIL